MTFRRAAILALLGFSSGLPLLLTSITLTARVLDAGIELETVAALAAVGLPYSLKWAWAPLLDRFYLPFLGRRRGWMLVTQLGLVAAILWLGLVDVKDGTMLAVTALLVATLSATQDVLIDAYRADLLPKQQRASGSAVFVAGYRAGMVAAGTLLLLLADVIPWLGVYVLAALLMGVGVGATLFAEEPVTPAPPATLGRAVVEPITRLWRLDGALVALAFVALYKLGDHFHFCMVTAYLKGPCEYTNSQVALANQLSGLAGAIVGGALAAGAVKRMGMKKSLVVFGLLQSAANIGYLPLAWTPGEAWALAGVTFVDYTCNGMGTAAFMAMLLGLCDARVSATQYALLTSLSSLGQRVFGFTADDVVRSIGWSGFLTATALVVLPALLLVPWLRDGDERPDFRRGAAG